jgi:cellobiose-specific phosphotransferase system component IIC
MTLNFRRLADAIDRFPLLRVAGFVLSIPFLLVASVVILIMQLFSPTKLENRGWKKL